MERAPADWHHHFFEGRWLQAQCQSFSADENRELAEACVELLQQMPGAKILDIPCGDGRIALELAADGFRLTGVDRSRELIDRARDRARERGIEAEFVEGDMRTWIAPEPHDGAVCLWSSFGYGSAGEDAAFLRNLATSLRPGALLVLDTHVVETLLPQWEESSWRWAGEILVAEQRQWDPESGRVETEWVLADADGRETRRSSIRIYTYRDLCNLLSENGFEDIEGFGSPALEPFGLGASRVLLRAARRNGPLD